MEVKKKVAAAGDLILNGIAGKSLILTQSESGKFSKYYERQDNRET